MERALRQNLLPLPRRHGLEPRELARHGRRPRGAVAAAAGDASFTARGRRGDDGLVLFAEADVDVNTAGPEAPRDERVGLAPLVAGDVRALRACYALLMLCLSARLLAGERDDPDACVYELSLIHI